MSYINERARDAWNRNVSDFFLKTPPFLNILTPFGAAILLSIHPGPPQRSEAGVSARDQVTATTDQGSVLWTLEEIGRLVSHSGNPAETLNNLGPPDQAAVRHRRLLGLPAGAGSVEPGARRHDRAASRGRRPDPHAAHRGPGRTRRRAAAAAGRRRRHRASALQVLPRGGRRPLSTRSSASRSSTAACSWACWSSRPSSAGRSARTMCGCWSWPARSWRRSSAKRGRSASRLAPAHQRLYALAQQPLVELGQRYDDALFRELDPVRWREFDHNPIALLQQIPIEALEERAQQLQLHSRINYAYRRMQEYLKSEHTWGARNAGVLWARPVAYFSAEFGLHESLPIYSGGLGILAGDHIKSASDLGIPLVGVGLVLRPGLLQAAARSRRPPARGLPRRRQRPAADPAGHARRRAGHGVDRHPHRNDRRASLVARGRPQHAAPARLERRRQPAGGPRADCAPVRRRRSRPHPSGAAARRRRRPRAAGDGHLPRRRAPERRPQRLCRAGADAPSHGQRGHRRVGGDPPRLSADRLHDAHAGAGRPRSLLAGSRRRAPRTAARSAPSRIRRPDGARQGQHARPWARRSA